MKGNIQTTQRNILQKMNTHRGTKRNDYNTSVLTPVKGVGHDHVPHFTNKIIKTWRQSYNSIWKME